MNKITSENSGFLLLKNKSDNYDCYFLHINPEEIYIRLISKTVLDLSVNLAIKYHYREISKEELSDFSIGKSEKYFLSPDLNVVFEKKFPIRTFKSDMMFPLKFKNCEILVLSDGSNINDEKDSNPKDLLTEIKNLKKRLKQRQILDIIPDSVIEYYTVVAQVYNDSTKNSWVNLTSQEKDSFSKILESALLNIEIGNNAPEVVAFRQYITNHKKDILSLLKRNKKEGPSRFQSLEID